MTSVTCKIALNLSSLSIYSPLYYDNLGQILNLTREWWRHPVISHYGEGRMYSLTPTQCGLIRSKTTLSCEANVSHSKWNYIHVAANILTRLVLENVIWCFGHLKNEHNYILGKTIWETVVKCVFDQPDH